MDDGERQGASRELIARDLGRTWQWVASRGRRAMTLGGRRSLPGGRRAGRVGLPVIDEDADRRGEVQAQAAAA